MKHFLLLIALLSTIHLSADEAPKEPLGLPKVPWPEDNPYSTEKAELGKLLYFDKRLSSDETVSCSSCHHPDKSFTDNKRFSKGIHGQMGTRTAPTIINAAYQTSQFWDGRAKTLEDQCKSPIANTKEMTVYKDKHIAHMACEKRIESIAGYRELFKECFGDDKCSVDQIAKAVAAFERTVLSGNSPYDRYMAGDKQALSAGQINGMKVFKKAGCANCHFGPTFSDGRFINIGIGMDEEDPDLGRYLITRDEKDWGAFKVPGLREVEHTFPYMHDGSLATLEDVVEYYNKGGTPNKNLHPLMRPLHLTEQEKKDLVSFLKALSGEGWQQIKAPTEFPK